MQALCLKTDKPQGVKSEKKWLFANFSANTFARTEWKLGRDCKINNKDLSFRVGEIMSLLVEEFYKFMGCYFL